MADGVFHDQSTVAVGAAFLIAGIVSPGTSLPHLLVGAAAFIISGVWFSPDLDGKHHRPTNRWGILRWIWLPLWIMGHRSWLSHGWVVGSLFRLVYFWGLICSPMWFFLVTTYGAPPEWIWSYLWSAVIAFILGGELHLLVDCGTTMTNDRYHSWRKNINGPR